MDGLTPAEAGAILKRSPAYVIRLIARGDLTARRTGPADRRGHWLIDAASVRALKAQWDAAPPQRGRPADSAPTPSAAAKRRSRARSEVEAA
jgi:hypothetical protein